MKLGWKKLSITLACLTAVLPLEAALGQVSSRSDVVYNSLSGNGGVWGTWTSAQYCPEGSWASEFGQRVEFPQGLGDDTALNSIALYCTDRNGNRVGDYVTPNVGYWGTWAYSRCPQGTHMTHFSLKVEGQRGVGDDTAANAVSFRCNYGASITARNAGEWGSWGSWIGGIPNAAVCGIRLRMESPQDTDNTALNNVRFYWCRK